MNFINNDIIELIIRKNNNTKKSVITLINLSLTSKLFYELSKPLIDNIVMELINFLIEHYFLSIPLIIVIILFFISNAKKVVKRYLARH